MEYGYVNEQFNLAKPILITAIENDIKEGRIEHFYKNFTGLSEEKLMKIVNKYGLLTDEEQKIYLDELKLRQEATRVFLLEQKKTEQNLMTSLGRLN